MREIWALLVPTSSASACWLSPLSIRNLISSQAISRQPASTATHQVTLERGQAGVSVQLHGSPWDEGGFSTPESKGDPPDEHGWDLQLERLVEREESDRAIGHLCPEPFAQVTEQLARNRSRPSPGST